MKLQFQSFDLSLVSYCFLGMDFDGAETSQSFDSYNPDRWYIVFEKRSFSRRILFITYAIAYVISEIIYDVRSKLLQVSLRNIDHRFNLLCRNIWGNKPQSHWINNKSKSNLVYCHLLEFLYRLISSQKNHPPYAWSPDLTKQHCHAMYDFIIQE